MLYRWTLACSRSDLLARTAPRCRRAYILPLWFFLFLSFFFLTPNLWDHWAISTELGHIFTYDCYLKKFGPTSPGIYPPPMGWGKTAFWGRLWTLTEHISATEHDINNWKETCQSTGTPLWALQILWTFVHKRLRTVGEFLPTAKFSYWETLPALPHGRYITEQTAGKLWHVLCSLKQSKTTQCRAGSRWALPCM